MLLKLLATAGQKEYKDLFGHEDLVHSKKDLELQLKKLERSITQLHDKRSIIEVQKKCIQIRKMLAGHIDMSDIDKDLIVSIEP